MHAQSRVDDRAALFKVILFRRQIVSRSGQVHPGRRYDNDSLQHLSHLVQQCDPSDRELLPPLMDISSARSRAKPLPIDDNFPQTLFEKTSEYFSTVNNNSPVDATSPENEWR